MTEINQRDYETSHNLLINADVPEPVADAVSRIVASDNPDLPNLGRTDTDNELVKQVLPYLNKDE